MPSSRLFNVRLPEDIREAFDRQAAREGLSTSAWLIECGLAYLPPKERKGLQRREPGQPKKPVKDGK